ncbi:MAG: hypothetical protein ACOX8V_06720 [Thermoleophilia bacterium]|jgi:hypothetical protein
MGKVIGTLHWDGCVDCKHDIIEKGGCEIDDAYRNIHIEGVRYVCDSYEKSPKYAKIVELKPNDRIKVTYFRTTHSGDDRGGSYTGQFRGRIHSSDNVAFSVRGEAIWVTTDQGVEEFTNISDLLQIEKLEF